MREPIGKHKAVFVLVNNRLFYDNDKIGTETFIAILTYDDCAMNAAKSDSDNQ